MKKLLFIVIFSFSSALWALPVGNPADASFYSQGFSPWSPYFLCQWSLRFGFWGDYVYNKYMKGGKREDIDIVQNFSVMTSQGSITLNWARVWDFFILVGNSRFNQETTFFNISDDIKELVSIHYPAFTSWGIGGRGTVWNYHGLSIGLEGEYFEARPRVNSFTTFADGVVHYPRSPNQSKYVEWQIGVGPSYTIRSWEGVDLIPYAAYKYSRAKLDQKNYAYEAHGKTLVQEDLDSAKRNGYAVGATMTFASTAGATIEGRFGNEQAVFVSAEIQF